MKYYTIFNKFPQEILDNNNQLIIIPAKQFQHLTEYDGEITNDSVIAKEITEEQYNFPFNKYTLDDNNELNIVYDVDAELNYAKVIKKQEVIKYYNSNALRSFKVINGNVWQEFIANDELSKHLVCNVASLEDNQEYYEYCIIGSTDIVRISVANLHYIRQRVEKYRKDIAINRDQHCADIDKLTDKNMINNYDYTTNVRDGGIWNKINDIIL